METIHSSGHRLRDLIEAPDSFLLFFYSDVLPTAPLCTIWHRRRLQIIQPNTHYWNRDRRLQFLHRKQNISNQSFVCNRTDGPISLWISSIVGTLNFGLGVLRAIKGSSSTCRNFPKSSGRRASLLIRANFNIGGVGKPLAAYFSNRLLYFSSSPLQYPQDTLRAGRPWHPPLSKLFLKTF